MLQGFGAGKKHAESRLVFQPGIEDIYHFGKFRNDEVPVVFEVVEIFLRDVEQAAQLLGGGVFVLFVRLLIIHVRLLLRGTATCVAANFNET